MKSLHPLLASAGLSGPCLCNFARGLCFAIVPLVLATPGLAQDTWRWTGGAGTTAWADAGNWDVGTAPALASSALQHVIINSGDITTTGAGRDIGRNTVGSTQTVTGGTLTIAGYHRYGVRPTNFIGAVEGHGILSGGRVSSSGLFQVAHGSDSVATFALSGEAVLECSHFAIASSNGGSVGTLNQTGGTLRANGTSGSFVGHFGQGTYNLSGGLLVRSTAGLSFAPAVSGMGILNQTGGRIELNGTSATFAGITVGAVGSGIYSISNASMRAAYLTVGPGLSGVVNIGSHAEIELVDSLTVAANGVINFAFSEQGVTTVNVGGVGTFDANAKINVDGSSYAGPGGEFVLIEATSFSGMPVVALTGFREGSTFSWSAAEGRLAVTVPSSGGSTALRGVPIAWYLLQGISSFAAAGVGSWEELDEIDTTGHGMPNWQVYLAGTDPSDPMDRFQITHIIRGSDGTLELRWRGGLFGPTSPYALEWSEELGAQAWTPFATHPREEGLNRWTGQDPSAGASRSRGFFRVSAAESP
jgi:hypothetical protein